MSIQMLAECAKPCYDKCYKAMKMTCITVEDRIKRDQCLENGIDACRHLILDPR